VAAAGQQTAATADAVDGGFDDDAVVAWMNTAVDPIDADSDGTTETE